MLSHFLKPGKDQVIFATKEDMGEPSKAIINIQEDTDEQPGGGSLVQEDTFYWMFMQYAYM